MDTTSAVQAVLKYKPLFEKVSKSAAEQAAIASDNPYLAGVAIRAEELNRATALLHDEHLDEIRAISSQEDAEALYIKMRNALGETKVVKAVMHGAVATNLDGVVDTLWK